MSSVEFHLDQRCVDPEPLELVELTQSWVKHVHHKIDVVQQGPSPCPYSLFMVGMAIHLVHRLHHPFRERSDMRVGSARRQDEVVCGVAQSAKVEDDYVRGLVVVQGRGDATKVAEDVCGIWGVRIGRRGRGSLWKVSVSVFYLIKYTPCSGADMHSDG